MRAQVLRESKPVKEAPLELVDRPVPEPGRGEIRLRVQACGVCHTDLHLVQGDLPLPRAPIVPGHQIVGVVDATGPGCRRRAGERLGVTWLYSACGRCDFCEEGRENLCEQARFTGYHHDGGFAEFVVVPEAFTFPLPESLDPVQVAPLLCAGVIGYRALRLSEIESGQRLGLFGFGASAHITIQIARHQGCEVYVFTRSPEHREHARELGATWAGGSRDTPPALMHGSVVFAPAGRIVHHALRVLRRGGTLAINAVHMSPIPALRYEQIYFERTLRSVANLTRDDARGLLDLAGKIPIRTDVESYGLEAANDVLTRLEDSRIRGAAVLAIAS